MENNQTHDSRLDKGNLEDQQAMENNDWEKEFDEQFCITTGEPPKSFGLGDWINDAQIKQFIHQTRLSAFQEGLEEALKWLPSELKRNMLDASANQKRGWNACRAEIISAITSRIEESKKGKI